MRRAALVGVLVAACGGGPPIPETDLLLRVVPGAEEVTFGRAFPLTVERVWDRTLVPDAWDDAALAPLVVRLTDTRTQDDGRRVREVRRYEAFALTLDAVEIAPITAEAAPQGGGLARSVTSDPVRVRVVAGIDRRSPGAAELPSPPLAEPQRALWAAGAATAIVATVLALRRRRSAAPAPTPAAAPAADPADVRALARFESMRALPVRTEPEVDAFHVAAAAAMRDYLRKRFGVPAAERTSDETLAALRSVRTLAGPQLDALAAFLSGCDLAKFARGGATSAQCSSLLDDACRFVRETAQADAR